MSSYYSICVRTCVSLRRAPPSSETYICVLILLYMCAHMCVVAKSSSLVRAERFNYSKEYKKASQGKNVHLQMFNKFFSTIYRFDIFFPLEKKNFFSLSPEVESFHFDAVFKA